MSGRPAREVAEEIANALAALQPLVEAGLAPHGWRWLDMGFRPHALAFTHDVGDGFWATAAALPEFVWPRQWPTELRLAFGAGYEPAAALMPIVTLRPRVTLLPEPDSTMTFTLSGPDAVDAVAQQLIEAVLAHGVGFADAHRSIDEMDAELASRGEREAPYRAVLQAAAGNHDQARRLLQDIATQPSDETTPGWPAQRVVRQLTRWLDGGGADIPPLQESLTWLVPKASMPQDAGPVADRRENAREGRAAVEAVRAVARGRSVEELTALLIAEHARRGIELRANSAAILAERMAGAQGPLGRVRRFVSGVGFAATSPASVWTSSSIGIALIPSGCALRSLPVIAPAAAASSRRCSSRTMPSRGCAGSPATHHGASGR